MKLGELTQQYNSISIVGMCKNAGKTTVLNRLIADCYYAGHIVGITSVGRDGEDKDVVTSTPKPEIFVKCGTLVATAKKMLPHCTTTLEILHTTGINTPLGEIVVFRTLSSGYVQIAGPSITSQLIAVEDIFRNYNANKILIDGALSRKSLCSTRVSQATILSTGASYSPDVDKVITDTAYMSVILSLPICNIPFNETAYINNGIITPTKLPLVDLVALDTDYIYLDGALTDNIIKPILNRTSGIIGKTIVVEDSSKIFLTDKYYQRLLSLGGHLQVTNDVNLVAITTNPISAYGYIFDAKLLKTKLQQATNIPVIDVETDYE